MPSPSISAFLCVGVNGVLYLCLAKGSSCRKADRGLGEASVVTYSYRASVHRVSSNTELRNSAGDDTLTPAP